MGAILIADSGSTKTDWRFLNNDGAWVSFETKGFNPLFTDTDYILTEIRSNSELLALSGSLDRIRYFGAGCSSDDRKSIVSNALKAAFGPCDIVVDHDMMGCAISLCQGSPGIASIIGTGSNCCYFDGESKLVSHHGLGHILGDEASGSYFGKKLVAYFLYERMPADLRQSFFDDYQTNKEDVLRRVYREPLANVYLSTHAKFLSKHRHHPFIENLLRNGIAEFIETNVQSYPEHINVPVHFTGSIAFHFKDVVESVLMEKGLTLGNIIQKPITGLCDYYIKY
ncbi:MAG: N-acetylglucosamine kinase [Bacteroidota bacterium]|jgi:N-acetylglucosamine kinase-like BadF-type ATPase